MPRESCAANRAFLVGNVARTSLPLALVAVALASACSRAPGPVASRGDASGPPPAPSAIQRPPAHASAMAAAAPPSAALPALPREDLAHLFQSLSEPGEYFFSDNIISNETSYLQVAERLATSTPPGGAYLGVGPEQNFTYIALTKPSLAFIVDIRRDNALLHLLYKAMFDEARTRAEWLTLLLGRPYEAAADPSPTGDVRAVLTHAQRHAPDAEHFATTHERLVTHLIKDLGIALSPTDREHLEKMHRRFFAQQLELRFELHEANGRTYPTLAELLVAKDPQGNASGFLASQAAFDAIAELERENRVIPIVGDFAGTQALQGIAAELSRRKLRVTTFYVSNVEQYLMEPAKWSQYVANVKALPVHPEGAFIRSYLDQGRRHPQQLEGHRTATFLQGFGPFQARSAAGYKTFWQLCTDG